MAIDVYSDPLCLTRDAVKKLTRFNPTGAQMTSSNVALSTTEAYKSIALERSSNALFMRFTPVTTMSKSAAGILKLQMPIWYVSDSTPPLHYESDEDTRKCKTDAMSIISDNMEENTLVIKYEYMQTAFIQG
jgi:hypothetical protein